MILKPYPSLCYYGAFDDALKSKFDDLCVLSDSNSTSSDREVPVGGIVGGVIGLLVVLFLYFKFHKEPTPEEEASQKRRIEAEHALSDYERRQRALREWTEMVERAEIRNAW